MLTTDCPILLLSSERSGSNLIRVMMGSHREVSAPASAQVIKTLVPLIALYGRVDGNCLLYTSPSPRDLSTSRMPSSA